MLGKHVTSLPEGLFPPLLDGFTDSEKKEFLYPAKLRPYKPGVTLHWENDPALYFHMIVEGKVFQHSRGYDRRNRHGQPIPHHDIPHRFLKEGDVIGLGVALPESHRYKYRRYIVTTVTLTPCRVLTWDKATIHRLGRKYPQLRHNLLGILADYIRWLTARQKAVLSDSDPVDSVERALHDMAKEAGEDTPDGTRIYANNTVTAVLAHVSPDRMSSYLRELIGQHKIRKGTRGGLILLA
jgi:CRP-like cAMP-binding protein